MDLSKGTLETSNFEFCSEFLAKLSFPIPGSLPMPLADFSASGVFSCLSNVLYLRLLISEGFSFLYTSLSLSFLDKSRPFRDSALSLLDLSGDFDFFSAGVSVLECFFLLPVSGDLSLSKDGTIFSLSLPFIPIFLSCSSEDNLSGPVFLRLSLRLLSEFKVNLSSF